MAKQAIARETDIDPVDRLEEKIRMLVDVVTRLRGEQATAAAEHARLAQEVEALRARLASSQSAHSELEAMRAERDAIRGRVSEMLSHLESI